MYIYANFPRNHFKIYIMRNLFYFSILSLFLCSSCGSFKKANTYNDDAYFDPIRDRTKTGKKPNQISGTDSLALAEKKRLNTIDTTNKYYNCPKYNRSDYYDNEYACRMRRFSGNNLGVGYYDSYYTNSYFYDQNPYHYGVSVYNGYNNYSPSYWNYAYNPNYNWGGMNGIGNNYNWGYGNSFGSYDYPSSYFNSSPYSNANPNYSNNSYWGSSYSNLNNYDYYGNNSWFYYNNPYWSNNYYTGYSYGNSYAYGNNYYSSVNGYYNNSYDGSSFYGPRESHGGVNPDISLKIDENSHKISNGNNKNNNNGSTTNSEQVSNNVPSKSPDNISRFNAIPTPQVINTSNLILDNSSQPESLQSKPLGAFETNSNSPKINNSPIHDGNSFNAEDMPKGEKGFWGKIIKSGNNSSEFNSDVPNNFNEPKNNLNSKPNNFVPTENHNNVPHQNGIGKTTIIKPH